jgi:hypothetical protein
MRIKSDFVTNSSSAAFVLLTKINGIIPKIDIVDIRKYFLNLGYAVALNSDYPFYKELEFYISPFYDRPEDGEEPPKYTMTLEHIALYDEESTEKLQLHITGRNPDYNDEHSLQLTKHVSATLAQNLIDLWPNKLKQSDVQLSVVIEPQEFRGDGWNGDPHGPYGQIYQCIEAESKFGRLFLKNGKLNFKLYDLDGNLVVKGPVEKL